MDVRFPTYTLREVRRPPGRGGGADGDDSFIQIVGNLASDGHTDLPERSRSGGLANGLGEEPSALLGREPALRAEVEAMERAASGEEPEPARAPAAPSPVGQRFDVVA